jgi:hypothetical protein
MQATKKMCGHLWNQVYQRVSSAFDEARARLDGVSETLAAPEEVQLYYKSARKLPPGVSRRPEMVMFAKGVDNILQSGCMGIVAQLLNGRIKHVDEPLRTVQNFGKSAMEVQLERAAVSTNQGELEQAYAALAFLDIMRGRLSFSEGRPKTLSAQQQAACLEIKRQPLYGTMRQRVGQMIDSRVAALVKRQLANLDSAQQEALLCGANYDDLAACLRKNRRASKQARCIKVAVMS